MAIIQWKQIDKDLNGNGKLTGSLEVSGSILLNGSEIGSGGGSLTDTGSFATTGSNNFVGNQYISGNLIPEALDSENGIYDLGSLSKPWRDLYITTGSLNFVRDGELVSSLNGEKNAIRVGNILITTASISVVSGSGDNLSIVQNVVQATVSSSGEVETVEQVTAPENTVSSSAQITALGFISESQAAAEGTISSSAQITAFGFISSSHTDVSALNTFTGSIDAEVTALMAATSSYLTSVPNNTVSSSAQITALGFISESADVSFDGDRIVSNTDLGDLFTNNFNAGTSGSVTEFLEAVFFPNTAPSITSNSNFSVAEFANSGSSVTTLTATDAESQTLTWSTGSSYTDDFVRVSSNGVVTLNQVPTEADFNTTDRGDGTLAHPVAIQVEDTIGATDTATIYLNVTANTAPKWRQTSIAGNVITTFTQSLNEDSAAGNNKARVYFTDDESDSITIRTGSLSSDFSNKFSLTISSTYVQLNQTTASLDYEDITQYNFVLTASDEHYEASQDTDSVTYLPFQVAVVDNLPPSVNDQTLSGVNENSANNANAGSITATDPGNRNVITFSSFTLVEASLNGGSNVTSSLGGTSQSDPHADPFDCSTSGVVTRKNGVYLNSDVADEYVYRVTVSDAFNTTTDTGLITIPIADDPAATVSTNGTFRIVESATSGSLIRINSNGFSGTQADLNANQSGTFGNSTNPGIAVNSSGQLSLAVDLSGSVTQSGDTLSSDITFTNTFGTTTTTSVTVNVVGNAAPVLSFTNHSSVLDSDNANTDVVLVSMSISDTEGDTPYSASIGGTDASKFTLIPTNANSSSYGIAATENLAAGTYYYNITASDAYDETTTASRSVTVDQALDYSKIYVYTLSGNRVLGIGSNYNGTIGISTVDTSTTPDTVTAVLANSPLSGLQSGSLGSSTFSVGSGTMTRRLAASGSSTLDTVDEILRDEGSFTAGNVQEQIYILMPSGSDLAGVPTSMAESFGGSTSDEFVLNVNTDNAGWTNTIEGANIYKLPLESAHAGYDNWFVIARTTTNTGASTFELRLTPSSGSAPTN